MAIDKATTQLLDCCSTLGTRIISYEQDCLVRTHSRALLLSHTLLPGCFPCTAQAGTMEQQEHLLSYRCSFQTSLVAAHGVQLCWPSKVRLQQLLSGADTSCKPRGEVENMGRRAMLSANKPRISYVCGKNFCNMVSDHPELSLRGCFHCLWLQGSNVALLHRMGH